ncbi:MAG: carboxypeptidase-like regulatory domain-containing protein [Saprospiraceae bacterium]|nr:carboxypeptidase-like regulatory domain-containing protein [Saprospiraceae bacterium]
MAHFYCGAQDRISSRVVDAITQEGLSFAHVAFKSKGGGTITNEAGHFELNCTQGDTLIFSYLGYFSMVLSVDEVKKGSKILLNPDTQLIEDVVVYADDDYLYEWLTQCRSRLKEENKPSPSKAYLVVETICNGQPVEFWKPITTPSWVWTASVIWASKTAGHIWHPIIMGVIFLILISATPCHSIHCSTGRAFFQKTRCSLERVR